MTMIELKNKFGQVSIDPYGAQVMSYVPTGGSEVLWRTSDDFIAQAKAAGKAVRGGIPICWPWFGPHPDGKSPQHGFARTAVWEADLVESHRAVLMFKSDGSHEGFPHMADVELEVKLDALGLLLQLTTLNTGKEAFRLSQALHTYLKVGDVGQVKLYGLAGTTNQKGEDAANVMSIHGEVDDIYGPIIHPVKVADSLLKRELKVESGGCIETVVWNPGGDKADVPPGGWKEFLCVEAANAKTRPLLNPDQPHVLSTRISMQ